ncbi:hypothetical protein G6F22_011435 [Rhizopus arrhizus]|nr:hypothetical protein G6F22_011435 [Rhizopus arrhizus]
MNNKATLTLKLFADEFGLLDKHYATARYKSIINTHHLSKEYELYWLEKSRRKIQLNTHESCAEYVQDIVEQETTALTSTTPTSIITSLITVYNSSSSHGTPTSTAMSDTTIPISHITNTITDTIGTTDAAAADYQELIFAATETVTDDVENTTPLEPWMFQGTNVAELFTKFQQAVTRMTTNQLLFIESSVHELLSLSNILLLCTSQYSPLWMDIFSEDILVELNKEMLIECMDFKQDMCDDVCMKLTRFMNNMDSKPQSKDDVEIDLLVLGRNLNPLQGSLLRGIMAVMRKLCLLAIKNKKCISECELFTMYFDPILFSLLSDPNRNVLLRWSNVTSDESGDTRPDATISKIHQRDFGPSLGLGEVKIARPITDNHSLCHDLLRLATLAKDTINSNKLQVVLTFQIHGFNITFFLSRLQHDGMYLMQEIGQLTFPRSLEELHFGGCADL